MSDEPKKPAHPPLQPGLGQVMGVAGGMAQARPLAVPEIPEPSPYQRPPPDLAKRLRAPRTLVSAALSVITGVMAFSAMIPLFLVLVMLIVRGGQRLSPWLFVELLTGVMLAVARAAGETAPLLFTAMFSDYWLTTNPMEPTPSLAVLIFDFSSSPFRNQVEIAWSASLVLVVLVLIANVTAQIWTSRSAKM
jgi:hypothetical protein